MLRTVLVVSVVTLVLLSTTETFFIRTRPLNERSTFQRVYPRLFRTRSPGLGRIRTRLLELEQFPSESDEIDLSLSDMSKVAKRPHYEDRGVVFPWNEWKCQVRGCRKRD